LSGRSPREAADNCLAPLKAVIGCITAEGFVSRYSRREAEQWTAAFQDDFAILARRNGQALKLELHHRFDVVRDRTERGPWVGRTAEYIYELTDERDDLIAAWHWHPESVRRGDEMVWPHLHAYGDRDTLTLHKLHLPTGRVSLESVVRFLIHDLEVIPRRPDWERVLEQHEQAFRQERTWS
jgi:hypothetical protein